MYEYKLAYLDLNLVKCLSLIDANNTADHFREDNHISEMCLDALQEREIYYNLCHKPSDK